MNLVQRLRKKAQSTLNTYTPGSRKTEVDPNELIEALSLIPDEEDYLGDDKCCKYCGSFIY